MKFVILWSDAFVFILISLAALLFIQTLSKPRLRKKWGAIFTRPLNLIAALILLVYCTVGTLDTLHFQSPNGVISLLDKIMEPLSVQSEKSYSTPFAIFSFSKEAITQPNGTVIRDYPRLAYGGAHLTSPSERSSDLVSRFIQISLKSIIIWLAFSVIFIILGCLKHHLSWEVFFGAILKGKTRFPWRTFLCSVGVLCFIVVSIGDLISHYHILGTSQVGEDVLYISLKSIRTGLIIGTVTTLITLPFAILFGIMAGYFRGWIDDIIQYIYTTLSSIPAVLLIAAAVLTLQVVMTRHNEWFTSFSERSDARLLALCAILGVTSWTTLCRLLRGETLKICEMDFVQAARSLGVDHFGIIFNHLLPNVLHIILITIAIDFSGLVLAEAVLSYVGVGVDPATYSWGTMINSARLEMARMPVVWWNLSAAFIFMFTLVLAANIFADAIRDAFDPRAQYHLGAL